jgi:bifunctional non-homologous end joining protein LigD
MLLRAASYGFIKPALPCSADDPPIGGNWIHEIKHDGYRLMVRRGSGSVRLLTRNGRDWSARFPLILEAAGLLRVRSCLIDGEAPLSISRPVTTSAVTRPVTDVTALSGGRGVV